MIGDLRAVIGWLPARERWRWFALVPVACLAAIIEAAGALAVFGLLRLVVDPEQVQTAPVVSRLWAWWPSSDPRALVAVLALGVGIFYVLRAAFLVVGGVAAPGHRLSIVGGRRRTPARALPGRRLPVPREAPIGIAHRADGARVRHRLRADRRIGGQHPGRSGDHRGAGDRAVVLGAADHAGDRRSSCSALVLVPIVMTRRAWERIGESERQLYQQQLHLLQQSLGAIKDVKVTGPPAVLRRAIPRRSSATSAPPSSGARGRRRWRALASKRR